MRRSIKTHKDLLKALTVLKPKYKKALLKACDEEEIKFICECIHNVLQGKIELKEKEKIKLKKYKNILRKIVRKGSDKIRKHLIVQKGGAFLPIILSSILSGLVSTFI